MAYRRFNCSRSLEQRTAFFLCPLNRDKNFTARKYIFIFNPKWKG